MEGGLFRTSVVCTHGRECRLCTHTHTHTHMGVLWTHIGGSVVLGGSVVYTHIGGSVVWEEVLCWEGVLCTHIGGSVVYTHIGGSVVWEEVLCGRECCVHTWECGRECCVHTLEGVLCGRECCVSTWEGVLCEHMGGKVMRGVLFRMGCCVYTWEGVLCGGGVVSARVLCAHTGGSVVCAHGNVMRECCVEGSVVLEGVLCGQKQSFSVCPV